MTPASETEREILDRVESYYSAKISEFGPIAKGVDWKDEAGQFLRFDVLSQIFRTENNPTICEIGSGYGAFVDYCDRNGMAVEYTGYDVSEQMIAHARKRFAGRQSIHFETGSEPSQAAEFGIASGIFNVRFDVPLADWWQYVCSTIDLLDRFSTRGFAFNCLTGLSDQNRMQDRLFYPMPGKVLDHCLRRFGRKVTLVHDYDLYEFTVLIRK